jgi:nicotinate-nucleotide adenylyltransferase
MELFLRKAGRRPGRLGILPGTFNPITRAHLELARAALGKVDEVLFVLPRVFPHKEYIGASFQERLEMLCAAVGDEERFSVSSTGKGLFLEIAAECRECYGPDPRLTFICGRDAAERITRWDYGRAGAVTEMLCEFDLLVAERAGAFEAPPELAGSIERLDIGSDVDGISATEVRRRITAREPWLHLVPGPARERARAIYT